jgi:5-hydroxyisourate hydrolase
MSHVTTHVLDAALGRPAAGIAVALYDSEGALVAEGITDADGRVPDLGPDALPLGEYGIVFETGVYFARTQTPTFYPRVSIDFELTDEAAHYHVPLLLSPFAFSTYRGS